MLLLKEFFLKGHYSKDINLTIVPKHDNNDSKGWGRNLDKMALAMMVSGIWYNSAVNDLTFQQRSTARLHVKSPNKKLKASLPKLPKV